MNVSLLQLYYKSNLNIILSEGSDLNLFNFGYIKYINFFSKVEEINNFETYSNNNLNIINIPNTGNYIKNIFFKFVLPEFETVYKSNSITYINYLLKQYNLNKYFNLENIIILQNEILQLKDYINKINNYYVFYTPYRIDLYDIYLESNNNIIFDLITTEDSTIYINDKLELLNFNNFNTNLNNLKYNINNKHKISKYLFRIYENNDLYVYKFKTLNKFLNNNLQIINLLLKKLLNNYLYFNINFNDQLLEYINNKIYKKIFPSTSLNNNIKFYYDLKIKKNINRTQIDNYELPYSNFSVIISGINQYKILEILELFGNIDLIYEIINIDTKEKYYCSIVSSNLVKLDINSFQVDFRYLTFNESVLDRPNLKLNLIDSASNINFYEVDINKSDIKKTNIYEKTYEITISNNLFRNINLINKRLIINENSYLISTFDSLIFTIYNFRYYLDKLVLYCKLYDYDKYIIFNKQNLLLSYIRSGEIANKFSIVNIKFSKPDTYYTLNYILNKKSNYLKNIANSDFKNIILKSIEYTIKYNFLILKNILNNIYEGNSISLSIIPYTFKNNVISNDDSKLIFNDKNKNTISINYFIDKLKKSLLNDGNNIILKNNINDIILPYVDIINEEIKKFYFNSTNNFNKTLINLNENNNLIYLKIIKEIHYVKTNELNLDILSGDISISTNNELYIFNDKNSNYLTKLKLLSKTLYDLDEGLYTYKCSILDNNLNGLYVNYFISPDINCNSSSKIINITSEILKLENLEQALNVNILDSSSFFKNKQSYSITYYLLVFIIILYNIINKNKFVSASGVILNNTKNIFFKRTIEIYYNISNTIKNYNYNDDLLKNKYLYSNYDFNDFDLFLNINYDNYIILYNNYDFNFNFKKETIINYILNFSVNFLVNNIQLDLNNEYDNFTNVIYNTLSDRDIRLSEDNTVYKKYTYFELVNLNLDILNLINITLLYINDSLNNKYNYINKILSIFDNNTTKYNKFLDNIFNIKDIIGYDINIIIDYYKNNLNVDNKRIRENINEIINSKIINLNDNKLNNFLLKDEYILYINIKIDDINSEFNYFKNNENLLNLKYFSNTDNFDSNVLKNELITELYLNGIVKSKYFFKDNTILFNSSNNGILDTIFNNIYDFKYIKLFINNNYIFYYNLLSLINIVKQSLFNKNNKKYIFLKNNIINLLNTYLQTINTDLDSNVKLFYNNTIKENLEKQYFIDMIPNVININNSNIIIFNEELYLSNNNDIIKISFSKIKLIFNYIDEYKNKNILFNNFYLDGLTVLKEIELVKQKIPELYFNDKAQLFLDNLQIYTDYYTKINDLLNINFSQNSIQKYYLYKNCILTYQEYNEISPKNNYTVLKILDVDDDGSILNYELYIVNNDNYDSNKKYCLSYGNGSDAYCTINFSLISGQNHITSITFINSGKNYVKNELVVLELYDIPQELEFIGSSFKYLKRKTDLPFELEYNYETNKVSRRFDDPNYILLNNIILNINNNFFNNYDYSKYDNSQYFNYYSNSIISFSMSDKLFKKYDINTDSYVSKNYTKVTLNNPNNYNIDYFKITNTNNYNGIYIAVKTDIDNVYEIEKDFILDETGTYSIGLSIIYNDLIFNKFINYLNLDCILNNNILQSSLDFINSKFNSDNIKIFNNYFIFNILNNLTKNFLDSSSLFNTIKIKSSNFIDGYLNFPNIINSNFKNIKNIILDNYYFNVNYNNIDLLIEQINYQINLLDINLVNMIKNYNLIKNQVNNLLLNPYKKGEKSKSNWITNLGYNIIKFCNFYIDDQNILNINKDYFYIHDNIFNIKKNNFYKLIGNIKKLTKNTTNKKLEYELFIKLPFWFNNISNEFLDINIKSKYSLKYELNLLDNLIEKELNTNLLINKSINSSILVDYIIIDNIYHLPFKNQLIEQIQYLISNNLDNTLEFNEIDLNFNYSIKDLFFVLKIKNSKSNQYYFEDDNNNKKNPIIESFLKVEDKVINLKYDDIFLTNINSYKYYNSCPDIGINIHTFSLYPSNFNPSGCFNFKIFSNCKLIIKLHDEFKTKNYLSNIHIFARNYNIINNNNGYLKLMYI